MENQTLVSAKPEDLRSERPVLSGNFVIAGEPKVFKTKTGIENKNSAQIKKQPKTEYFIDKNALNKNISLVVCFIADG